MVDPDGEWAAEPWVSTDPGRLLTIRQAQLAEARQRLVEAELKQHRVRLLRARLGIALRIALIGALLVAMLLLSVLALEAARSNRLVVKAFDVPDTLRRSGATGEAIAASLADELIRLERLVASQKEQGTREPGRTGIEVEPARPGLSTAGIRRLLAESLGGDRTLTGSVIRAEDGTLRLTVRGDGVEARSFTGRSRDLPLLAEQAAEHVFGSSQPVAWLAQLNRAGRPEAASQFAATAYQQAAGARDRSEIARLWAEALADQGRYPEAQERARLAISLDPAKPAPLRTLVAVAPNDEAALAAARWLRTRAAGAPAGEPTGPAAFADEYRLTGDWSALSASMSQAPDAAEAGAASVLRGLAEAYRHDYRSARQVLAATTSSDEMIEAGSDLVAGLRELELGRADRAVAPLERFEKAVAASGRLRRFFRGERCHLALAYARIGRSSDALRVLADGKRSARCRALRGDVLALAGKWPEAARAYRLAIATYPSLPVPYERAGTALLAREQPKAAAAMFRSAIERGPRWADPRFGMAEALMQAGRVAEAEREYRAAAPLAPRWGALRIGWGEALWRLGRQEEARQAWQAAVRMDLSGANRLRLQQLLALAAPSPSPVWP